ncbi:MAG TPA: efflux RND transporter periplasmic adaptor subunit [Chitinophagaceae bacterium]|nr:efflux RND transporter periplasmic adaptor subunit [Chitinophagaceae bacterium]
MKRLLVAIFVLAVVAGCNTTATENHEHAPDGSHPGEEGLQALSYTLYSDKTELFVEFKPLVVGQTSTFAAHLTKLGDTFLPYTEGIVTVSLLLGTKGLKQTAIAPSSPGIFRLALQPSAVGKGKLIFDITASGITDQIVIPDVEVYANEAAAIASQALTDGANDISFLKEQAWKIEFTNMPVTKDTIYEVLKVTGEIQSAPGDDVTIASRSNGIVKFLTNNNVIGASVRSGQPMFGVSGGEIAFENVEAAKEAARAELSTAKAEYDRISELIKDKLVTQTEYRQASLRYEQAQIALANLSRNYSGGKNLSSPINGYVKTLLVSEGQYVNSGQPLAIITKNNQIILKADVSLKDAGKIQEIREAQFSLAQSKELFNSKELNGRLLSIGKTTSSNSPFIPVFFQIDRRPELVPGSFADIYLKTKPVYNVLIIPVSALIEEQGAYYAYVQTKGESFQKRELKLGVNDGKQVQVVSGISEGERVVVKGAYQIKLTQASGTMPAHGHEH